MKKIQLLKELQGYPVFNVKIIKELIKKDRNYAKLVINRLRKEEFIFQIEKNKYTLHKDPLMVASHIVWPSYISGWSGLRYHNITEQIPQNITVFTTRQRKNRKIFFQNSFIEFVKIKPKFFFGYQRERYGDFDMFVGEKEKVIIDCALLKIVSFSEICDIIKDNLNNINTDKLIEYLKKINNKTLIKRFGYVLSKLNIEKYNLLKKFIDFKYITLDYFLPKKGLKNKKWRVIENVEFE